jgi:hypothetical protein
MWVLTPRGFFSVVQDRDDACRLLVRTRVRADLDSLRDLLRRLEPVHGRGSDYPWRAWVDRSDWTQALATMCAEIDYGNFKKAVTEREGGTRSLIYGDVWLILRELEHLDD